MEFYELNSVGEQKNSNHVEIFEEKNDGDFPMPSVKVSENIKKFEEFLESLKKQTEETFSTSLKHQSPPIRKTKQPKLNFKGSCSSLDVDFQVNPSFFIQAPPRKQKPSFTSLQEDFGPDLESTAVTDFSPTKPLRCVKRFSSRGSPPIKPLRLEKRFSSGNPPPIKPLRLDKRSVSCDSPPVKPLRLDKKISSDPSPPIKPLRLVKSFSSDDIPPVKPLRLDKKSSWCDPTQARRLRSNRKSSNCSHDHPSFQNGENGDSLNFFDEKNSEILENHEGSSFNNSSLALINSIEKPPRKRSKTDSVLTSTPVTDAKLDSENFLLERPARTKKVSNPLSDIKKGNSDEINIQASFQNGDQISITQTCKTPVTEPRKISGILHYPSPARYRKHSEDSREKHHAVFASPPVTNVRSEEQTTNRRSQRASVTILDESLLDIPKRDILLKAHSISALTQHEHEHPSQLNVKQKLKRRSRIKAARSRIGNAFKISKTDNPCWPRVFRRKRVKRLSESDRLARQTGLESAHSAESFASIFLANEDKMFRKFGFETGSRNNLSGPLFETYTTDCGQLFKNDPQELVEFPQHVKITSPLRTKNKPISLRERLLKPRLLLSTDSAASLDSLALKKAYAFLENSIRNTGSDSKLKSGGETPKSSEDALNSEQASVEGLNDSNGTLNSKNSLNKIDRAISQDDSSKPKLGKMSLKTKFFLRATSIPDMAPRILKAFSKSSLATENSTSVLEDPVSEQSENSKKISLYGTSPATQYSLGSLISSETIKENDEEYEEVNSGVLRKTSFAIKQPPKSDDFPFSDSENALHADEFKKISVDNENIHRFTPSRKRKIGVMLTTTVAQVEMLPKNVQRDFVSQQPSSETDGGMSGREDKSCPPTADDCSSYEKNCNEQTDNSDIEVNNAEEEKIIELEVEAAYRDPSSTVNIECGSTKRDGTDQIGTNSKLGDNFLDASSEARDEDKNKSIFPDSADTKKSQNDEGTDMELWRPVILNQRSNSESVQKKITESNQGSERVTSEVVLESKLVKLDDSQVSTPKNNDLDIFGEESNKYRDDQTETLLRNDEKNDNTGIQHEHPFETASTNLSSEEGCEKQKDNLDITQSHDKIDNTGIQHKHPFENVSTNLSAEEGYEKQKESLDLAQSDDKIDNTGIQHKYPFETVSTNRSAEEGCGKQKDSIDLAQFSVKSNSSVDLEIQANEFNVQPDRQKLSSDEENKFLADFSVHSISKEAQSFSGRDEESVIHDLQDHVTQDESVKSACASNSSSFISAESKVTEDDHCISETEKLSGDDLKSERDTLSSKCTSFDAQSPLDSEFSHQNKSCNDTLSSSNSDIFASFENIAELDFGANNDVCRETKQSADKGFINYGLEVENFEDSFVERCADTGLSVTRNNTETEPQAPQLRLPASVKKKKKSWLGIKNFFRKKRNYPSDLNTIKSYPGIAVESSSPEVDYLKQLMGPSYEEFWNDLENESGESGHANPSFVRDSSDEDDDDDLIPPRALEDQNEDVISPEKFHLEIENECKFSHFNEAHLKHRNLSPLLKESERRRIRANSILESEFEVDEESNVNESNIRRQIKEGLLNKTKSMNFNANKSEIKPNDDRRKSILEIDEADDFFDYFRDRPHEEHYAHILESDSDNEQEKAIVVGGYLANARRGSVDALSNPSPSFFCKMHIETGYLNKYNLDARRGSLHADVDIARYIDDDIFDYFTSKSDPFEDMKSAKNTFTEIRKSKKVDDILDSKNPPQRKRSRSLESIPFKGQQNFIKPVHSSEFKCNNPYSSEKSASEKNEETSLTTNSVSHITSISKDGEFDSDVKDDSGQLSIEEDKKVCSLKVEDILRYDLNTKCSVVKTLSSGLKEIKKNSTGCAPSSASFSQLNNQSDKKNFFEESPTEIDSENCCKISPNEFVVEASAKDKQRGDLNIFTRNERSSMENTEALANPAFLIEDLDTEEEPEFPVIDVIHSAKRLFTVSRVYSASLNNLTTVTEENESDCIACLSSSFNNICSEKDHSSSPNLKPITGSIKFDTRTCGSPKPRRLLQVVGEFPVRSRSFRLADIPSQKIAQNPSLKSTERLWSDIQDDFKDLRNEGPNYCHARKALFPNLSNLDLTEKCSTAGFTFLKPDVTLQTWNQRQKSEENLPTKSSSLVRLMANQIESSFITLARSGSMPILRRNSNGN